MKIRKIVGILAVCALLAMPFSMNVSAAVPFDNLIALYNMEGGLTNSVTGNDGILMNGAGFVSDGQRGSVLFLNNADVVSPGEMGFGAYNYEGQHAILSSHHVPMGNEMSISVWFRVAELRTWARVIDFGDAQAQDEFGPNYPARFISISATNSTYTIATTNVNDSDDGVPNNRDRVFADMVGENEWIHAVYVINAQSGSPNVLYLNGTPFESTNAGGSLDDPDPAHFAPRELHEAVYGIGLTFLGRSRFEANADQIFYGWIDDVAIFDVALTAEQVAELAATDFSGGVPGTEPAPAEADAPEPEAAPEVVQAAEAAKPAPPTADPITLAILGSLAAGVAGAAIARKKK